MGIRVWVGAVILALLVCVGGCQKPPETTASVTTAGPYPECRSIVEWVRVTTGDPEALIVDWGPREELKEEAADGQPAPVRIVIRYRPGPPREGVWSQKLRVVNRRITPEGAATEVHESDP